MRHYIFSAALLAVFLSTCASASLPQPTAWYKLDETSGLVVHDSVEPYAHGKLTQETWLDDGGIRLGDVDNRVFIGSPDKLKFTNNLTLAVKVKIRSGSCRQVLGAFPSGGLKIGADEIEFSSWDTKWVIPYLLPRDAWVHIVATLDSENYCRVYLNGREIKCKYVKPLGDVAQWWTIGTWDGGEYFQGDVADVKIWNSALTADQVMQVAEEQGLTVVPKAFKDDPAPVENTPQSVIELSDSIKDIALQPDQLPRYPIHALLGEGRTAQALHLGSYEERAEVEKWFGDNIPLFDCPDPVWERCYYYRWFVTRVNYAEEAGVPGFYEGKRGSYTGHITYSAPHIMDEVRWLRDSRYAYGQAEILGKRREPDGRRMGFYTHWIPATLWDTYLVHPDKKKMADLLPAWKEDVESAFVKKLDTTWQDSFYLLAPPGHYNTGMEHQPSWFWFDNYSGKETRVYRPDYTAYYYANALAVGNCLRELQNPTQDQFYNLAEKIKRAVQNLMWDDETQFFYSMKYGSSQKAMVKEVVGIYPFAFALPDAEYASAYKTILDPEEFWGEWPVTTCTMKSSRFESNFWPCNWNGPVWPHAESLVAQALANGIRVYKSKDVTPAKLYQFLDSYTKMHYEDKGTWQEPNVMEAADAGTGKMHGCPDYFHSTYVDLLITLVGGLVPRNDDIVELWPVVEVPWDHFRFDRVPYHGHILSIVWDNRSDGQRYEGVDKGFSLYIDGKLEAHQLELDRMTVKLDESLE